MRWRRLSACELRALASLACCLAPPAQRDRTERQQRLAVDADVVAKRGEEEVESVFARMDECVSPAHT